MSPIMELIRETEHPANSFSPDVIKYAFEAHNDLQHLVEWVKTGNHKFGCHIYDPQEYPYPIQNKCSCGLSEIQSLLGE